MAGISIDSCRSLPKPMKTQLISPIVYLLAAASGLQAANIAWISFHADDNTPSTGAAGAGFSQAPDVGYTNFLTANGHTVTRFVGSATPNAAVLNTYDLIIASRSTDSGNFAGAGATAWNTTITAPMMIMSGYALRDNRMGFTTGQTMPDTFNTGNGVTDSIRLTATAASHPIFTGLAVDGGGTMINSFATEVTFGTTVQRGISVNTNPLSSGGTVLATVGTAGDAAFGGMVIGYWGAGSTMANSTADVLAGNRLVFLSGSREANGVSSNTAGIFDLDQDGQLLFLNAVNFIAIPEPSVSLLGLLGALGLLRRRR
jgi:hypothetical protein